MQKTIYKSGEKYAVIGKFSYEISDNELIPISTIEKKDFIRKNWEKMKFSEGKEIVINLLQKTLGL